MMKFLMKTGLICLFIFAAGSANAQSVEGDGASRLYYYSGVLGSNVAIEFNLQVNTTGVSGSYIVERSGDLFTFSGRFSMNRKGIGLLVYDSNNSYVASIEANVLSEENNFAYRIEGKWKSASGEDIRSINLKKVAEYAQIELNVDESNTAFGD